MSNTLEYIIKLKDQFSSGLNGIGSRSSKLFNNINRKARTVPRSIDEINKRLDKLTKERDISIDTSEIKRANREIRQLEGQLSGLKGRGSGRSGGGGLLSLASRYAIPAAIATGAYRLGKFGLSAGSEQENTKIGLRTFLGDKTDEAYANIQKDAANTPFDLQSLVSVNRSLISAGTNAKDARADTLALANAVSAVGGGNDVLSRMAANMQQIRTVGKATAMDIRQFGMAGINIYALLEKATGRSVDEIKKMEIGYDTLSYALRQASMEGGLYFNAMESQSKSLSGRWNTMWDNFKADAGEAALTLKPVIDGIMTMGASFMGTVGRMMQRWSYGVRFFIADFKIFTFKLAQRITGIATAWDVAILKVKEFGDIGMQKLGNLYQAAQRFMHLDFKGAKQYWNKEEKSEYTEQRKNYIEKTTDQYYKNQLTLVGLQMNKQKLLDGAREMESRFKSPGEKYKMQLGALGSSGRLRGVGVKKGLGKGVKSIADRITGGGARNVTINLGKFFDNLHINTTTLKEGSNEVEAKLMDMLLRVLNSGGAIVR